MTFAIMAAAIGFSQILAYSGATGGVRVDLAITGPQQINAWEGTDLINSVGISILIGVIERVRGEGGILAFSELTPVNEEIFRIMGLHRHARLLRHDSEAGE